MNSNEKMLRRKSKNIRVLRNPKTDSYLQLKDQVLSMKFPWFYRSTNTSKGWGPYDNFGFYFHNMLVRPIPIDPYPRQNSDYLDLTVHVIKEIFDFNNIKFETFLRICVNAVHPTQSRSLSVPHKDHDNLPHKNLLVYLTDCDGGETRVEGDEFFAKEDDIITWDSQNHNYRPPSTQRRIVLVATYL